MEGKNSAKVKYPGGCFESFLLSSEHDIFLLSFIITAVVISNCASDIHQPEGGTANFSFIKPRS
jgi:hypothetical protein